MGPEYPGEGAIKHFIAGSTSAEYSRNTQKNEKNYECVVVTHQKKKKWFQKSILGVKAATNTWRESGDWVALNNIINRGSTHLADLEMERSEN